MSKKTAGIWYVMAIVGAILALPVSCFTTCTAGGPKANLDIGFGFQMLLLGSAIGVGLTIALVYAAIVLRRQNDFGSSKNAPPKDPTP